VHIIHLIALTPGFMTVVTYGRIPIGHTKLIASQSLNIRERRKQAYFQVIRLTFGTLAANYGVCRQKVVAVPYSGFVMDFSAQQSTTKREALARPSLP
jgi:hypothetical protein